MSRVTEIKRIRVRNDCPKNPVYLRWRVQEGGWGYWLFAAEHTVDLDVSDPVLIDRYVADLETADTRMDYVSKKAANIQTVGTDGLDRNDLAYLATLFKSVKVQVWLGDTKWLTVRIPPGSMRFVNLTPSGSVEFTLVYPEQFLVSQ